MTTWLAWAMKLRMGELGLSSKAWLGRTAPARTVVMGNKLTDEYMSPLEAVVHEGTLTGWSGENFEMTGQRTSDGNL